MCLSSFCSLQTAQSAVVCGVLADNTTPLAVLNPVAFATAFASATAVASSIACTQTGLLHRSAQLCILDYHSLSGESSRPESCCTINSSSEWSLCAVLGGIGKHGGGSCAGATASAWAATTASLASTASASASAAATVSVLKCLLMFLQRLSPTLGAPLWSFLTSGNFANAEHQGLRRESLPF